MTAMKAAPVDPTGVTSSTGVAVTMEAKRLIAVRCSIRMFSSRLEKRDKKMILFTKKMYF